MLVCQMNRMENCAASQPNQQTGIPNFGKTSSIERNNNFLLLSLFATRNMALSGEVSQPSVEERLTESIEGLESLNSSVNVKSTGSRSVVAALFKIQQSTTVRTVWASKTAVVATLENEVTMMIMR